MHEKYFKKAAEVAKNATCYRAKCGSVIVSRSGKIIGKGFNAPPLGDESQRKCDLEFFNDEKLKYDKTCCIHAEWSAIIDALSNYPKEIVGSTLYFMRVSEKGEFTGDGVPFCTVCSRLTLQSGIKYFGLWNDGPMIFDTKEYNDLSYKFHIK